MSKMTNPFCGEISYHKEGVGNVHSDICFSCGYKKEMTDDYRKFVHDCLDEWLNAGGTGAFWLAGEEWWKYIKNEFISEWLTIQSHMVEKEMKGVHQ